MTTYQLKKFEQEENEAFRADFNAALRKNAKQRIFWMLKDRELKKYPVDEEEILPKELFEI